MPWSATLLLPLLLAVAAPATAQTEIHRCIGANGGAVFTDQPCAALQATAVNPALVPVDNVPVGAPPILCAASPGDLRQSVIDAFASHDANRLAGLMLWDGYGRGAAIANIRSLGELVRRPLLDIDGPDDPAGSPAEASTSSADPFAPAAAPPPDNPLLLHMAGNDGSGSPQELRFSIVHRAGCLWLRNAE